MESDKLYFKRNYSINPLLHEHIHLGGEFSILEGQTWEQVAEATLGRVDEFVTKHFPHAFAVTTDVFPSKQEAVRQVEKPNSKENMLDMYREQIRKCTTMPKEGGGLLSFEALVKNTPELQQAYDETLIKLTNKK